MSNLNDIFNMPTDVKEITKDVAKTKTVDENLYQPSVDDAPDGVYTATLRFLPYIKDIKLSTISKYVYYLKDANDENGFYVDDPQTIGEKSPIAQMYWKLKNSKNAVDNKLAENFNRNYYNYSLVEIVKDPQHPELVGQIKVFRYGKKIKEMIDDESNGDEPCNVFDPFNGKNFNLKLKRVGGFNNYDSSKFGNVSPMTIDGEKVTVDNAGKKKIVEYLDNNSPDITVYDYKEWDAEMTEKVNRCLRTYTGEKEDISDEKPIEAILKGGNNATAKKETKKAKVDVVDEEEDEVFAPSKPSGGSEDFFNLDDIDL